MKRLSFLIILSTFCLFLLCACHAETTDSAARSMIYAQEEITLPDGWRVTALPKVSYDAHAQTVTVDVYRDLEPLADGFVPSEYTTATFDISGELLSINGYSEFAADTASAVQTNSAYPEQHPGAIVQAVYPFDDGTAMTYETLYSDHKAGVWLNLFDENGTLRFTVSPSDCFDYDLSRDIGAAANGGDFFSVTDVLKIRGADGTPVYCVLTTEGLCALYADSRCAWAISDRAPAAVIWVTPDTGADAVADAGADTVLFLSNAGGKQSLRTVDTTAGTLGEAVSFPEELNTNNGTLTLLTGGGQYPLYVKNRTGLYGMTPTVGEDGTLSMTAVLLADWAACEMASDEINGMAVIDEDTLFLAVSDMYKDNDWASFYRCTYVNPEDVIQNKEIVLAQLQANFNLQFAVRDFNKHSDTHRIVIRDYTQYDDAETQKLRLDTDIAAGNIPDIYIFGGGSGVYSTDLLIETYASAGALCDLKELFSADPDFGYDNLLSCVTTAFETADGKQYRFPLEYTVSCKVGHSADFPPEDGIPTAEEYLAFCKTLLPGQYVATNDKSMRNELLDALIAECYDMESGICTFDDGRMEAFLLELDTVCATLTYPASGTIATTADKNDLFRQGTMRVTTASLSSLTTFASLGYKLGEDTVFLGTPNDDGFLTASINAYSSFAVSSVSEYKAEAVKLLGHYLANNSGKGYDIIPFYKSDIDASAAYYAGQTFVVNGTQSGVVHDARAEEMPGFKYKLTDDDVAAYKAFLDSLTRRTPSDTAVSDIFWEEYESRGTKSYREMLDTVQSRAEIYLAEQK